MANMLKMERIHVIQELYDKGWTQRRIARELGVHRKTIRRHLPVASDPEDPKCTIPTPGSGSGPDSKCTIPTAGILKAGRSSQCEPWRQKITDWLDLGLSAQRIYQDLCGEAGFVGSYESVKRFLRSLRQAEPHRFERMECAPGDEVQVDFGTGSWVVDEKGRRRRTHVFRMVLSQSRKGYSEAVFRQDTETFIRCLENAFRYFGGTPKTVVPDNLKAAIPKADWYDPDVHPKLRDFATYYHVVILPTKPYHPHHKGKVERGIGYVKDNALKGRTFKSLAELNAHLLHWEEQVADQRIHGTTRKQVAAVFEQQEKAALHLLPPMPFPAYQEGKRSVHRDGFVEVQKAYYEAPVEYVGRILQVRWDSRTVRLFNHRMEEVALHARVEPGVFSYRTPGSRGRVFDVQQNSRWLLKEAQLIGHWAGCWAEGVIMHRGQEGIRTLQGLRQLTRKHTAKLIDQACERALTYGAFRLRDVRRLAENPPPDQPQEFEFMTEHPLIRGMDVYQAAAYSERTP